MLAECDGPPLPPLETSMAHFGDAGSAVHAVATITCELVADHCADAGNDWAASLLGEALASDAN